MNLFDILSFASWVLLVVNVLLVAIIGAVTLLRRRRCATSLAVGGVAPTSVLLLIAHPDDEAMFFVPSILTLRESCDLHVLVGCVAGGCDCL